MEENKKSFNDSFLLRKESDSVGFFSNPAIQKAYFVGAYAKAVINSSYNSEVSKKNSTYKNWLSNKIINFKNLDRIFEMAFRFEQKLKLKIRNGSEVRRLAHEVPQSSAKGLSSSKVTYAFVAGFDDYGKFTKIEKENYNNNSTKTEE